MSIVLVVTAANQDLANSYGLKMALEVDPEGTMTIGHQGWFDVSTIWSRMLHPHDEILFSRNTGTDVVDILAGCIYVPVVSHSQRDIKSLESIVIALKHEHQFFKNHPSYKSKAQCCDTPWLTRWLNIVSIIHLQDVHLPAWLLTLTWASVRSGTTLPLYFVLATCLIELFCISIYGYSISQQFPITGTNNLSYAWISHMLHLSHLWALDFASSAADYPIVDLVPSNLWISDGTLAVITADFKIGGDMM